MHCRSHVQPQEEVGVHDVAALDNVIHVPHFAVERPAHLSKARSQLPNLATRIARVLAGDAAKEEKPGTLQLRDGAQQATWIRKVVIWHFEVSARGSEQSGCRWPQCGGDVVMERAERRWAHVGGQERCGKKERWRSGLAHEICTPSSAVWTAAGVMDEGISEVRCNFCLVDGWTQDGQVHESLSQR